MARLDPAKKLKWKEALSETSKPWVICGIDSTTSDLASRLEGMVGLIDWSLHGQVSRLLLNNSIEIDQCCLIPGDPALKRPSYLMIHVSPSSEAKTVSTKAKKLGINEVALAESTFPEDFLAKLKQTFKKEGIGYLKLEPET